MASIAHRQWTNKDGSTSERYQVTYSDGHGKRSRQDFATRRQANRFIETLSSRPRTLAPPVSSRPETFGQAADAYLTACEEGRDGGTPLEAVTLREYRRRITQHIIPHLGCVKITDITPASFRQFRDTLVSEGLVRGTARKHLFLAKAILKHAVYLGWLSADPSASVVIRIDKRRENDVSKAVSIHTREEMSAILDASRHLSSEMKPWVRFNAMLHTLVYSGLRMSELRGLPSDAIDLTAGTLKVYQRADADGVIGPPKSRHGYRTIHMPIVLQDILGEWRTSEEGLLFPTDSGKPISHSNLANRMWRKAQVEAGVTILHPHAARHFFASMLIHGGASLKALQDTMGHHDPMFTMRVYGHLFTSPEDVALRREMAESMARILTVDSKED